MKMNDTVARIVEIMFQDVEQNEETAAIRDEVMNNCQERFADLVNSGVSEDDAITAVIESLKGMDDVLAPYKRKHHRRGKADELDELDELEDELDEELDELEDSEKDLVFAASEIHQIDLSLVNEDVRLEESDDDMYHVRWDADENPQIAACLVNGMLRITRLPGEWDKKNTARDFRLDVSGAKNARVTINGQEVHFDEKGRVVEDVMDGVGSMMENLGRSLSRLFGGIRNSISSGDGVTIQVPENAIPHVKLLTTSGDIDVQDVALTDLNVTSTSGDINIDLDEDQHLSLVELRTTSGDIEVSAFAETVMISSTSGDAEVEGRIGKLTANTISGDIDMRADVKNMTFKAVSGDVDLTFNSVEIRDVRGSTISGDIDIDLPDGIGEIAIHTQTRTGDVTTRCHTNGVGPTVTGSVTSMSGDITIS